MWGLTATDFPAPARVENNVKFGETHGKLVTDFVCGFRINFTGLEALPDVIGQHVSTALIPPGDVFVLSLGKYKFLVGNAAAITIA